MELSSTVKTNRQRTFANVPVRSARLYKVLLSLLVAFLLTSAGRAWEVSTHRLMGRYARDKMILAANASGDLLDMTGADVLQNDVYWKVLEDFLEFEDQGSNPAEHFYSPTLNTGLSFAGVFSFRSAPDRAEEFWNKAIQDYKSGVFGQAFSDLGRVCHLVEDMGCPAHTLNDAHPDNTFTLPIFLDNFPAYDLYQDTDALHVYARTHENTLQHSTDATLALGNNFREVMIQLAKLSSAWDSDDRCGSGPPNQGGGTLNGFSGECPSLLNLNLWWTFNGVLDFSELQRIADDCVPKSEMAMAKVLALFFQEVRPRQPSLTQPQTGKIYSGIAGVPLHVEVHPPAGVANLKSVRIEYRDNESLLPNQWNVIKEVSIVGDTVIDERWFNTIDSGEIKLRAVVVDTAGCESIPALVNIKIDSTPPKILNTKP